MKYGLISGRNPGPYTGTGTNTYLLPGSVPTLIDTAVGHREFLDEVAAHLANATPTPLSDAHAPGLQLVLVTHGHPDHVQGARAVGARFPTARFAKYPWPGHDDLMPEAWRPLADDEVVAAGDGHLWVLHTPGHSPDHVCFYDPHSAVVFVGDLVQNGGTVVIPARRGGHLGSYLRSLRRILDLQPRRLLPGHGPPVENPSALIRAYLAHRQQREQQVVDVLKRGPATVEDIATAIYPGLGTPLLMAARESILAHLVRLGELGHCRADERDRWTLV